jgi:hypothetical protein
MSDKVELSTYEKTILGRSIGLGLRKRGADDNHVVIDVLIEDDGNWFANASGFSSFYMDELYKVYNETRAWLNQNCGEDIKDGRWWGWVFKG